MGYTSHTLSLVERILKSQDIATIVDLGAQNNYAQPNLPAPYMKEWYQNKGISYVSIDINGENGSLPWDLSKEAKINKRFDLVVDAGTSEHVGNNGTPDIEAYYNCWKTKHDLLKVNGIMISENPEPGNWPGHGFNYVNHDFYNKLIELAGYIIIDMHRHPAMGNETDGWNTVCILKKINNDFPTLEQFRNLPVFTE